MIDLCLKCCRLFSDQDERSRDEVPLHRRCPVQALPIQDVLREGLGLQVSLEKFALFSII